MPKVSKKNINEAIDDARRLTGLRLLLNDVPGEFGLRLLGAPAGEQSFHAVWLSPKFSTRDDLMNWLHGFLQGWTMRAE